MIDQIKDVENMKNNILKEGDDNFSTRMYL
jgi:hypothetical protein